MTALRSSRHGVLRDLLSAWKEYIKGPKQVWSEDPAVGRLLELLQVRGLRELPVQPEVALWADPWDSHHRVPGREPCRTKLILPSSVEKTKLET